MTYLTEERRLIQESAREFAMREVLPVANRLDPEKADIPMELREKMAEMGYFGILIPEEYGGLGLGCFEYCIVAEELSKAWMSVASLMARANGLIGMPVMSEEQRRNYLPRMARGDFIGCVAISEPDVGSDVSGHRLPRPARRRQLGHQRQQILVHLRRRRRLHDPDGAHLRSEFSEAAARRHFVLHVREAPRHASRKGCRAIPSPRSAISG